MLQIGNILYFCWLLYYAYWIIAAWLTRSTEEVRWRAGNVWWNISIFVAFFLLRDVIHVIPHSEILNYFCLLLVFTGMIIAMWARWILAGNWSYDVALKKQQTLTTSGMYHSIRHPIYTGFLLMWLGTALYIGTVGVFSIFIVLAIFLWIKLKKEEELLLEHFPKEYAEYRKHSKTLIPFLL